MIGFSAQSQNLESGVTRPLTDEEINAKIFKRDERKAADTTTVFLPFYYEGMEKPLGQIKSKVTKETKGEPKVEIDADAIFRLYRLLIVEEWYSKYQKLDADCREKIAHRPVGAEDTCYVALEQFKDDQVKLMFDFRGLELRLHVPPELRTPKSSSLFGEEIEWDQTVTDEPSSVSSYVNMNFNQVFANDTTLYANGREPLAGYFDSGSRIGSVIVEANGRYDEPRSDLDVKQSGFVREDVRAVYDFPENQVRTQVGDVLYPVQGFQSYVGMGGVSVFRQFGMQPSKLTLPGGNYEVYLARPSKVIVYVNDQVVQVLELPAGRHNIRDFPFNAGVNDVRLEIVDDAGRTESLNFSYFSNARLLKPGLNEFSYSVGAPWEEVDGVRKYHGEHMTYSLYHRMGLTESYTMGANVQHDNLQTIAGLESLLSTSYGLVDLEPALSATEGRSTGTAARFRYMYQDVVGKEKSSRTIAVEAIYTSEDFAILEAPTTVNPSIAKILTNITRGINKNTSAALAGTYQFSRKNIPGVSDSYSVSAGLTRRWSQALTTTANFRDQMGANGKEDIGVFISLVYAFTEQKQVVSASGDSISGNARADWSYQPKTGVGGVAAQANVRQGHNIKGYGGMLDYKGNRLRAAATQDIYVQSQNTDPTQPPEKTVRTTTLQLGTALVYAGGHIAMSRPINDAFAIFAPQKNLIGQNVLINPQSDDTFLAETDFLGPAVLSDLPSYSFYSAKLGDKNLKPGTSIPRDHFVLNPPYHGGYGIPIGTDDIIYLKVLLVSDNGPLEMISGQAICLTDPSKTPVTIFTNRAGLVRSEGFRPGKYRLEIPDFEPIEFTIPETESESYDLGQLKLKPKR